MRYKVKITFISNGRTYQPGSILPDDISSMDLDFLKEKGFVELADLASIAQGDAEDLDDDAMEDFLGELGLYTSKSPEEIRKIRSKKEVVKYAGKIGLDLGENYEEKSLKDLQEAVINFQEEQMENEQEGVGVNGNIQPGA